MMPWLIGTAIICIGGMVIVIYFWDLRQPQVPCIPASGRVRFWTFTAPVSCVTCHTTFENGDPFWLIPSSVQGLVLHEDMLCGPCAARVVPA